MENFFLNRKTKVRFSDISPVLTIPLKMSVTKNTSSKAYIELETRVFETILVSVSGFCSLAQQEN